jgi:hypothetical protein
VTVVTVSNIWIGSLRLLGSKIYRQKLQITEDTMEIYSSGLQISEVMVWAAAAAAAAAATITTTHD